jgi:phosphoribosyl-dephospho-CoA transferase
MDGEDALTAADAEDLRRRLTAANRRKTWHGVCLAMGMSPAAVIPFIGLALEGSVGLARLLAVAVAAVEGYQWARARRDVTRLHALLTQAESRISARASDTAVPARTHPDEEAGWRTTNANG